MQRSPEQRANRFPDISPSNRPGFNFRSLDVRGGTGSGRSKKSRFFKTSMVLPDRIELSTSPLPRECSTTELRQQMLA